MKRSPFDWDARGRGNGTESCTVWRRLPSPDDDHRLAPRPRSRARFVLSMMQRPAAYPQKVNAWWKKHFILKRSKVR